jgi:hypothetical protein
MVYAQLQIVLLDSQEHQANNTARELVASLFDKLSTLLAGFVHSCGTGISVVHASWLLYNSHSPNVQLVCVLEAWPDTVP